MYMLSGSLKKSPLRGKIVLKVSRSRRGHSTAATPAGQACLWRMCSLCMLLAVPHACSTPRVSLPYTWKTNTQIRCLRPARTAAEAFAWPVQARWSG